MLTVENAVLNYAHDRQDPKADATLTLSKAALNAVQLKVAEAVDPDTQRGMSLPP